MSQYSDIISDGGMDPRADYEAKRKVQNLESSIKDLIEGSMQYKKERDALMKALKSLICTAEKDEINKNHLDTALRKARNVIADIDPTIEKCDCCY